MLEPKKINTLRKQCPKFVYEGYNYGISGNDFLISFNFQIPPHFSFSPEVKIKNIPSARVSSIKKEVLDNFVFHLGLIEMFSYWKLCVPRKIDIRAGFLTKPQIAWWKKLLLNGMGEFFYKNKINFTKENFLEIKVASRCYKNSKKQKPLLGKVTGNSVLVPVGGGKDSIVTLEMLKKLKRKIYPFSLSQNRVSKEIIECSSQGKNKILAERKLDTKLLELNRKGYLNGHTPFSAYLAFLSVLVCLLFNCKHIAFSNERSANEGNVKYFSRMINHQYSKTFDFENRFRNYLKKYLSKSINYFSFLRPLYEIQIVKIFSKFPKYFPLFLSCNEAFKTSSGRKKPTLKWCGKCPKCLFVFASLYPFLGAKKTTQIFHKNLFNDKSLLPLAKQLAGLEKTKPFECVGEKKESLAAFYLSFKKVEGESKNFYLLNFFKKNFFHKGAELNFLAQRLLNGWSEQNNLPKSFEKLLKNEVKRLKK